MKKIAAIMTSILMLVGMAGCGSKQDSSNKLIVGTSADFAPYEFHILEEGKDKIVGFDMALAQAIADKMGKELVIKDMSFESIMIELQNGSIDLAIAGMSPDEKRKKVVDFSKTYYEGSQSVMINVKDKDKYKTYEDLNKKELSIGAQTGSIQADLAQTLTPNAKMVGLAQMPNIIMELKTGKIDAAFVETVIAENYEKAHPEVMILSEVPYEAQGNAVAIKKGNEEMLNTVNEVIDEVLSNGKMAEYIEEAVNLSAYDTTKNK